MSTLNRPLVRFHLTVIRVILAVRGVLSSPFPAHSSKDSHNIGLQSENAPLGQNAPRNVPTSLFLQLPLVIYFTSKPNSHILLMFFRRGGKNTSMLPETRGFSQVQIRKKSLKSSCSRYSFTSSVACRRYEPDSCSCPELFARATGSPGVFRDRL